MRQCDCPRNSYKATYSIQSQFQSYNRIILYYMYYRKQNNKFIGIWYMIWTYYCEWYLHSFVFWFDPSHFAAVFVLDFCCFWLRLIENSTWSAKCTHKRRREFYNYIILIKNVKMVRFFFFFFFFIVNYSYFSLVVSATSFRLRSQRY